MIHMVRTGEITNWFCIRCNANVSEELGIKRTGFCPECKREARFFPSYSGKTTMTPGELMKTYNVWTNTYNKKTGEIESTSLNMPCLAEMIFQEFNLHFITTSDSNEIWFYNGSYYEPNGEHIIRYWVEQLLEEDTSEYYKREVVGYIRDKNPKNRQIFDNPLNLINLQNGVYNLETGELLEHSPSYHFINELPVKYNKKAKCPKIKKFLFEIIYEEDIPVIQEFFGYCLYRRYSIHKMIMLLGEGKNGKSTLLNLLRKFLGQDNVSGKDIQGIISNRFGINSLYGKLANIAGDMPSKGLKRTGILKSLTGEDVVNADIKYKKDFNFVNFAKFIFSANTLPMTDDDTYAFYRRWILISFPYTFEGKNCDTDIIEKISTEKEMSGLFNYAVAGLKHLLKNGDFSYGKSVEEIREHYKTLSDPVYAYSKSFLKCEQGKHILKDKLRAHHIKWCKKHKLPVTPPNMLTQRLNQHLPDMRAGKIGPRGKQKPAYTNITWNEDAEKADDAKINLDTFPTGEKQ